MFNSEDAISALYSQFLKDYPEAPYESFAVYAMEKAEENRDDSQEYYKQLFEHLTVLPEREYRTLRQKLYAEMRETRWSHMFPSIYGTMIDASSMNKEKDL